YYSYSSPWSFGNAGHKSAAAVSAETAVPVFHRQRDPDFNAVAGRRMRDDRRDADGTVAFIDGDGFDGRVGDHDLFQFFGRTDRRRVGIDRFQRKIRRLPKGAGEWDEQQQHSMDVELHGEIEFRRRGTRKRDV